MTIVRLVSKDSIEEHIQLTDFNVFWYKFCADSSPPGTKTGGLVNCIVSAGAGSDDRAAGVEGFGRGTHSRHAVDRSQRFLVQILRDFGTCWYKNRRFSQLHRVCRSGK